MPFTLEHVELLMTTIRPMAKGEHLLFVKDDSLRLCHRTTSPVGSDYIAKISASEINRGLTANRWDFIDSMLRAYNEKHPS